MRSLFSFRESKEMSSAPARMMRRVAASGNARIVLALTLIGVPLSGYLLVAGNGVALGVNLVWLAVAAVIIARAAGAKASREAGDGMQASIYRNLVENGRDGVLRFSSEGNLLFTSQSCEALFGCRRYELSGAGLGERLHVADRPAYLTAFAEANNRGVARTLEVRMRRDAVGESRRVPHYFWAEIAFSQIAAGGGKHEVVALLRDISARKDHEAEMRAARKAAEQASEAKSRFLATIGHELRTPLNAVVGFSDMMMHGIGGELNGTQREYAGLINQSGKHLLEVVGMLLDMSKIEAGRFELQTEVLAPETLIDPCFKIVEGLARERGVKLSSEIAYPLPSLMADERACRQILINLLSNAIKFSHEGGVVTVAMKRQGQSLNISVTDRGIGMDPSTIGRIGEPFFQANDGLDRRHEGTGLGLSIVKGLADLHNGTLRAISEVGAGTTVTVLLPLNGPAINNVETMPVPAVAREPASPQTSSWHDEKRKAL